MPFGGAGGPSGRPTQNSAHTGTEPGLPDTIRRRNARAGPSGQHAGDPAPMNQDPPEAPHTQEPLDPSDDGQDDQDPFENHPHQPRDSPVGEYELSGSAEPPYLDQEPEQEFYQEPEPPNLADAITLLARTLRSSQNAPPAMSKVCEPDQFDGDSRKLCAFLMQLELNFNDRPTAFSDDRAKVNYALSFLKGNALDWFEPTFANMVPGTSLGPSWLRNYSEFVKILQTNFGPYDQVRDAEFELKRLQMKDNHHITKFLIDFNRVSALTGWGNSALRHQFYRGMPPRIKDEMARVGKPTTLEAMKVLAQGIDARYWEHRAEISRESPAAPKQTPKDSASAPNNSGNAPKAADKRPNPANQGQARGNAPQPSRP